VTSCNRAPLQGGALHHIEHVKLVLHRRGEKIGPHRSPPPTRYQLRERVEWEPIFARPFPVATQHGEDEGTRGLGIHGCPSPYPQVPMILAQRGSQRAALR